MFENLKILPQDPLLGLILKFREDMRKEKIDLGVGVYKDTTGRTPILACVKEAEENLLASEDTKSYVGPGGNILFNEKITELVFGDTLSEKYKSRISALQTPGGCGALRGLAELIKRSSLSTTSLPTVWISDPTWANHIPLLSDAGLSLQTYPYYDQKNQKILFDEMMDALQHAKAGDVVLLHGCCHNPSGADLSHSQWDDLVDLVLAKGLLPLIDMAYQGFGGNLAEDAYGARLAAARLPEAMLAISCSKNFGLYRERVGCALILSKNDSQSRAAHSHLMNIVRGIYSMPPSHGASIVAEILTTKALENQWYEELSHMRDRIYAVRVALSKNLRDRLLTNRFDFIENQVGMFSFLGISAAQVECLASDYGIYMAENSRVCISGLNENNLNYFSESLAKVIS